MDAPSSNPSPLSSMALFEVYLRLRPQSAAAAGEQFLDIEDEGQDFSKHITIKPPASDQRKRAVERFGFTRVFEESASQLDILNGTELPSLVQGVLAPEGQHGRDGLLATLGVTGSGKSHTILGTKSQRGLTQMSLALLYRAAKGRIVNPDQQDILEELAATDVSEAHLVSALDFLDSVYGSHDSTPARTRTQTPLKVSTLKPGTFTLRSPLSPIKSLCKSLSPSKSASRLPSLIKPDQRNSIKPQDLLLMKSYMRAPKADAKARTGQETAVNTIYTSTISQSKKTFPRVSNLPQNPRVDDIHIESDESCEYAVVMSMYEVYNNGIYDLFTNTATAPRLANKEKSRRALLFKSTEYSQDRKVVAGLKKVVCASFEEALLVINAGLAERRIANTKANSVSSRSHGFIAIEVKRRQSNANWSCEWSGNTLTIADLAGSERADLAKTAGSTLAEAGNINQSLMYLGQCMQMQSDNSGASEPSLVPYRSCKLTEILFSNDFQQPRAGRRAAHARQKAIMIVTADPKGDFNATSQILRYSALAREVTVPRIASTSSTIINPALTTSQSHSAATGRASPTLTDELARAQTEIQILQVRLAEETARREGAEASLLRLSQTRAEAPEELEARVRAECMDAAEARLRSERDRWNAATAAERARADAFLDGKVGILTRATAAPPPFDVFEDDEAVALREDRDALASQVAGLQAELRRVLNDAGGARTPSRKVKALSARKWTADVDGVGEDGENLDY